MDLKNHGDEPLIKNLKLIKIFGNLLLGSRSLYTIICKNDVFKLV